MSQVYLKKQKKRSVFVVFGPGKQGENVNARMYAWTMWTSMCFVFVSLVEQETPTSRFNFVKNLYVESITI